MRSQYLLWGPLGGANFKRTWSKVALSPNPGPEDRSPNQVSSKTCFEDLVGATNFWPGTSSKASSLNPGPEDRYPNQVPLRRGPKTCFEEPLNRCQVPTKKLEIYFLAAQSLSSGRNCLWSAWSIWIRAAFSTFQKMKMPALFVEEKIMLDNMPSKYTRIF